MTPFVLIAQSIVIIWLIILLTKTIHGFGKRIDQASRHLQTDKPEDPKPICGCSHHQCFHDDSGCKHASYRWDERTTLTCTCLRYTGPEALPTVLP